MGTPEQCSEVCGLMSDILSNGDVRKELSENTQTQTQRSVNAKESSVDKKACNNKGAADLLSKLRWIMWDHVAVVQTPMGLTRAVSLVSEIREEACHLFEEMPSMETAGIHDASHAGEAVAQAVLNNSVIGGAHCIALESPESSNIGDVSASSSDE